MGRRYDTVSLLTDYGLTDEFVGVLKSVIRDIAPHVTTIDLPTPGGVTANTAFLKGGADGPNATAVSVTATFWLETLQGQSAPTQLQYTQTVLLNFNGISWPHVTVGTLHKA